MMHEIRLEGCRPTPLAHYLKALAILRLVGEQADAQVRGAWKQDCFVLRTKLSPDELLHFFLHDYCPTPIIAPWNGGSGFNPKDNTEAISTILDSDCSRLDSFRTTIRDAKKCRETLGIERLAFLEYQTMKTSKDLKALKKEPKKNLSESEIADRHSILKDIELATKETWEEIGFDIVAYNFEKSVTFLLKELPNRIKLRKSTLLQLCRSTIPDASLPWFDAAVVLTMDKARFPPLLGTGGNDGRLDFTNNFMQRLLELMEPKTGAPSDSSASLLNSALLGCPTNQLKPKAVVGQFLPSGSGGANGETGFDSDALTNPWDFVFMLEGAANFAASFSKRGESDSAGALAYPFTVRSSAAGYGSAAESDVENSRAEMWLPIWAGFASKIEIDTILSEGRAQVGNRQAASGVDFARAVSTLGIDRGITEFQRYGFQVRNGLAYFATPLARVQVRERVHARLLDEIDTWLERLFSRAKDKHAPGSVKRQVLRLQDAIVDFCQRGDAIRSQTVLVQLSRCEMALANSLKFSKDKFLSPLPMLSQHWLDTLDWQQPELRLAAALASTYADARLSHNSKLESDALQRFRYHLEPVASLQFANPGWNKLDSVRDVTWQGGGLCDQLTRTMSRRLLLMGQNAFASMPDRSSVSASLDDIERFIRGDLDDAKLQDLIVAMSMVDFRKANIPRHNCGPRRPGAFYKVLKLCYTPPTHSDDGFVSVLPTIRLDPKIYALANAGRSNAAWQAALRRLRGSGFVPMLPSLDLAVSSGLAKRVCAALIFPIRRHDAEKIAASLRIQEDATLSNHSPKESNHEL